MQSVDGNRSANEPSPEFANPDSKMTYLEKHTRFFMHQIRHLRDASSLPPDVKIVCKDGQTVFAHKFVLFFTSQFFKCQFLNFGSPYFVLQSDLEMETVHLTLFSAQDVNLLIDWIYRGEPPPQDVFEAKVFDLMTLANYLLVDIVKEPCNELILKMLKNVPTEEKFALPMRIYSFGLMIGEETITTAAENIFFQYSELHPDLNDFSLKTILCLVKNFDSSKLHCVRSPCRLTVLPRERFLVELIAGYIKHDKAKRLRHATELFKCLKLALIATELDFDALGLPELKDSSHYTELHQILDVCRNVGADDNLLTLPCLPENYWTPRPGSIKYCIWSKSQGNFRTKLTRSSPLKTTSLDQNSEVEMVDVSDTPGDNSGKFSSKAPRFRRFTFQRPDDVGLTGVQVYSHPRDGKIILGGVRFTWSDGTQNEIGNFAGKKHSLVTLEPFETLDVFLASDSFPTAIKFRKLTMLEDGLCGVKHFGPYGRPNEPTTEIIQTTRDFRNRLYLNGLKGYEVSYADGSKAICSLSFKMAFNANFPLEHHFKLPSRKSVGVEQNSFDEIGNVLPPSESLSTAIDNNSNTNNTPNNNNGRHISIRYLREGSHTIRIQDMRAAIQALRSGKAYDDLFEH